MNDCEIKDRLKKTESMVGGVKGDYQGFKWD